MTSKEYMSCVTAIDPMWLVELAPLFFSVKEDFGDGFFNKNKNKGGIVNKKEIEIPSSLMKDKKQKNKDEFLTPLPSSLLSTRENSKFSEIVIPGKTPLRPRNTPRTAHYHGI